MMVSWRGLVIGALVIGSVVVAGCDRTVAGLAEPTVGWHPTPTTTAPPPTTTTVAPPPTAADGTNYAACATRTCQVSVSGPVDIRFGGSAAGTMSITKVYGDAVDFTLALDDGENANGTLKPGCGAMTVGGGGMSGSFGADGDTSCATQAPTAVPGAVTLEMSSAADSIAIIWIAVA